MLLGSEEMKKRDWKVALISVGATLGVILIAAMILRLCSFEIVYDPKVITNWDAVAAVAAWVGIIFSSGLSAIAIWCAIQVPKKIAEHQYKIDLFEKRYEVLQIYEKCVILYETVSRQLTVSELRNSFRIFFTERTYEELDGHYLTDKMCNIEYILHQIPLLYPKISENDVQILYNSLNRLLISLVENDMVLAERNRYAYIEVMERFKEKYQTMIWNETRIADINKG